MLALIALVATSITALVWVIRNGRWVKQGALDAAAANAAVNNVGPGQHTLYEMIETIRNDVADLKRDQEEYDSHGWGTLPADLNTAVGMTITIRDLQRVVLDTSNKLDVLIQQLQDESGVKFSSPRPANPPTGGSGPAPR